MPTEGRLRLATSVCLDVVFWVGLAAAASLVVCALLPMEASKAYPSSALTPSAKEALWSLNDTTTFDWGGSMNRIVVEKGRDGSMFVTCYPARAKHSYSLPVFITTDGDVADLYRRVTGKEHPTLKGKLSEPYQEFLEKNRW